MLNMLFTIELDGESDNDGGRLYEGLEISRSASTIKFVVRGMNGRISASGTCEPSELVRMAEILGEPDHE